MRYDIEKMNTILKIIAFNREYPLFVRHKGNALSASRSIRIADESLLISNIFFSLLVNVLSMRNVHEDIASESIR